MKKLAYRLSSLALVIALAVSAAACSSNNNNNAQESSAPASSSAPSPSEATVTGDAPPVVDEPVTLTFFVQYADDNEKIPYDYFESELKKVLPNVTIEKILRGKDDSQLLTMAASGNMPDLFNLTSSTFIPLKNAGAIEPIDEYVTKFNFDDKMLPGLDNVLYAPDGKAYAFPFTGNNIYTWYYNKKIFADNNVAVPTTYPELLEAVRAFRSKDITPIAGMGKVEFFATNLLDTFAIRYDAKGAMKLDTGEAKATDPQFVYAAEKIAELTKEGAFQKGVATTDYPEASALFTSGKAAMFMNGDWDITSNLNGLGDDLGIMEYPTAPDKETFEQTKGAMSGGQTFHGYTYNPKSKHKELAAWVAQFAALKTTEARYVKLNQVITALKIDKPTEKPLDAVTLELLEKLKNATSYTGFSWTYNTPGLSTVLTETTTALLVSGYSAEQFIEDLDDKIRKLER